MTEGRVIGKRRTKKRRKDEGGRRSQAGAPASTHPSALSPQPFPAVITKGQYCAWSGRQVKTVNEQAGRYGMPTGGPTVDLAALVKWLHDFLADNSQALAASDPATVGSKAAADLRKTLAQAQREELRLARERGELIERLQADQQRVDLVRWMVGVFDRMGSELHGILAGVPPEAIKREVDHYMRRLRTEIAKSGQQSAVSDQPEEKDEGGRMKDE